MIVDSLSLPIQYSSDSWHRTKCYFYTLKYLRELSLINIAVSLVNIIFNKSHFYFNYNNLLFSFKFAGNCHNWDGKSSRQPRKGVLSLQCRWANYSSSNAQKIDACSNKWQQIRSKKSKKSSDATGLNLFPGTFLSFNLNLVFLKALFLKKNSANYAYKYSNTYIF